MVLVLVTLTFVFAWLGVVTANADSPVSIWWPAAGVSVLPLLLAGPRRFLAVAGLLTVATAAANALGGREIGVALAFGLGNAVETAVIVLLLWRHGTDYLLSTLSDFWLLCRATLVGVLVSCSMFAATVEWLEDGDSLRTFLTTIPSHASAVLLIVPFALAWAHREVTSARPTELVVQGLTLLGVVVVVLGIFPERPIAFAILPPLAWAAMRAPMRLVTAQLLAVAVTFIIATRLEHGSFVRDGLADGTPTLIAEAFAICIVLATLPLALARVQQTKALRALREREDALREETRFSGALLDIAADLVFVVRRDGVLLQATRGLAQLAGLRPEAIEGRPVWSILGLTDSPDDGTERWARIRQAGPDSSGVEIDLRHVDGSSRRVVLRTALLPGKHEGQGRHVVVGIDVTRERDAAGLLGHILSSPSPTAMIGTDLDGRMTLVNKGAEDLLGIDGPAMLGRPVTALLAGPGDVDSDAVSPVDFADVLAALTPDIDPQPSDWSWQGTGPRRLVSTTASEIRNATGGTIGYLVVGYDVTAERLAAEQQRLLDQAKNDFVWTTSHEIRTPISSIVGYTELLIDGMYGELTAAQHEAIAAIDRNALRLQDLAANVLALAGSGAGADSADHGLVDLTQSIRRAAAEIRPQAEAAGVGFHEEAPGTPVEVLGSANALDRVVLNLLGNAVKFTPSGGEIRLTLSADAERATLEVTDTGVGIPNDEIGSVFERFFRASTAHADAIQGTGLGLPIVASIVERHRGTVSVASEPGSGSTFTVTLPLAG